MLPPGHLCCQRVRQGVTQAAVADGPGRSVLLMIEESGGGKDTGGGPVSVVKEKLEIRDAHEASSVMAVCD